MVWVLPFQLRGVPMYLLPCMSYSSTIHRQTSHQRVQVAVKLPTSLTSHFFWSFWGDILQCMLRHCQFVLCHSHSAYPVISSGLQLDYWQCSEWMACMLHAFESIFKLYSIWITTTATCHASHRKDFQHSRVSVCL